MDLLPLTFGGIQAMDFPAFYILINHRLDLFFEGGVDDYTSESLFQSPLLYSTLHRAFEQVIPAERCQNLDDFLLNQALFVH